MFIPCGAQEKIFSRMCTLLFSTQRHRFFFLLRLCCNMLESQFLVQQFFLRANTVLPLSVRTARRTRRRPAITPFPPPTCRTPSASSRRCRSATRPARRRRRRRRASLNRTRSPSTSTAATPNSKTFTSGPTSRRRGCRARWRRTPTVREHRHFRRPLNWYKWPI